jgi:hypothetical protein
MESTTYGYSKFVGWTGMVMFVIIVAALVSIAYYMGVPFSDARAFLCFIVFVLLTAGLFIYFLEWCFIPMITGAIALELDEEKLNSNITGKTIYWKDVVKISVKIKARYPFIIFEMVNGRGSLDIPTGWIEGSTEEIYEKMNEYLLKPGEAEIAGK